MNFSSFPFVLVLVLVPPPRKVLLIEDKNKHEGD